MNYLKEQYIKTISDKLSISVEDLLDNELEIIIQCFNIFNDRLEDIKHLKDENKRLAIDLANEKAYNDKRDDFINDTLD